ncbi:4'-phosphopantetheinyl transferase family protein [Streptomyces coeruleoprunus]|uniref:4'-phosphopantetheinyl transferase family protein n=1 Tax=Streptomyces coeruleoprunus TaxID=285563 RepID=A0ABV9X8C7_9ACTN
MRLTTAPAHLGTDPLPDVWEPGTARPHLWAVRVTEYATRASAQEHLLDGEERARCQGFARPADRDRYRVAHVALRRLLGAYLDRDPAAVPFVREPCPGCGAPHGRPAVPGAPLHFSLSHAGDVVLLAFAGAPVGVDVEEEPSAEVAAEVAAMLHPAERAEVAGLPLPARPSAVNRCWARKEAYLKGVGIGLGEDPSVTYVGTGTTPAAPHAWTLTDVACPPGYAAACAVRTANVGTGATGTGLGDRLR